MSSLFTRWQSQGAPPALRWWIPSPTHLSRKLHEGPETSLLVTTFAGACALATGLLGAGGFSALARAALEPRPARDGALAVAVGFAVMAGGGALPLAAAAFGLARTRPQLPRMVASLATLATLAIGLIGPGVGSAAVLAGMTVVGIATLSRATPGTLAALRRTVHLALALAGGAALSLVTTLAIAAALPSTAAAPSDQTLGPVLALVGGLLPLCTGALMALVHRADTVPWTRPDTWRQASLEAGNVLRFADGGAARQAPDAFGGYVGPVVVIPLRESARGAFRADGAPDDGWTVPGTVASLREAVARSEHAALATLTAVFACAAAPLLAGLVGALGIVLGR